MVKPEFVGFNTDIWQDIILQSGKKNINKNTLNSSEWDVLLEMKYTEAHNWLWIGWIDGWIEVQKDF